jgi:simple sugar transport system ATP-binding protein
VLLRVEKDEAQPGETVLQLEGLKVLDNRSLRAVRGVSLEVRAGEILGIAGVQGNGQRELTEAIVGLRPALAGTIRLKGQDVTGTSVRERREAGLACVPEDRYVRGLALRATLEDNLIVANYHRPPMSKGAILDLETIGAFAEEMIETYDVRTIGKDVPAYTLSGGNLQKVVIAREISAQPELLIAAQPTRGLDIGSIEFVHRRIVEARDAGTAVLLVSAELEEVMSLSDRIAVLYEGKIVGEVVGSEATEQGLGLWMAGITDDASSDKEREAQSV